MANYQIYLALDGGNWNGNPAADPVANVGGIDLSVLIGTPMFPAAQGTGDAQITCNFGQHGFAHPVPSGYVAGWPAAGGGFTTLDPAKAFGSGSHLSGGNLIVTFSTVVGMVQTVDGYAAGQYYFELTCSGLDIFSDFQGGGVGQNYAINGGDFNHWFTNGAFAAGKPDGGAIGIAASGGALSLGSLGSALGITLGTFKTSNVLRVAMFLSPGTAPPTPPIQQAVPQSLSRWRGQVGINWMGMALVGDAFSNVIGLSDFNAFTEYGNTMRFLVTTPPVHDDRKRIFVPRFEVEVEAGQGLPTPPFAGPEMMLDISKDGGVTFTGLQKFRSMGAVGEYIKRLRWINLGNSRTWIFRLTCTDPVRRYIIGTYIDEYKGQG